MIVERISGSGAVAVNINRHLPEEFRDKFKCTRQDAEVNVICIDIENKTYELIKHPSPLDYWWMFSEALAIVARLDELRIYQGEDLDGDLFISGGFGWCDGIVFSNPVWEFIWEHVIYLPDEDFRFVSDSKSLEEFTVSEEAIGPVRKAIKAMREDDSLVVWFDGGW